MLVYSVENKNSFNDLKPVVDNIHRIRGEKGVPLIIVGI